MSNQKKLSRRDVFSALFKKTMIVGSAGVLACTAITPAKAGYGTCSKCSCAGFKADWQNDRVCANCGHSFGDHW